jgi:iron(II)-dependent oxidoreductase
MASAVFETSGWAAPPPTITTPGLHGRAETLAKLAAPSPMATIPAGWFLMGTPPKRETQRPLDVPHGVYESPQRRIWLDAYAIDRHEVSRGQYVAWVLNKPRAVPPNMMEIQLLQELERHREFLIKKHTTRDHAIAALPIINVSWQEADDYCRFHGKRLPTEAEWEKAARGEKGLLFPWGKSAPTAKLAAFGRKPGPGNVPLLEPVESMAGGRSPYGLSHMAGNVAEWVADWFGLDTYATMPDRNPKGPSGGQYKVIRGGAWTSSPEMLRAATRGAAAPTQRSQTVGFRCATSGSPAPP